MKIIIILVMFLSVFTSTIKAEIRQVLDGFPRIPARHHFINRSINGTFEFVTIPKPLTMTTVNFTLVYIQKNFISSGSKDSDWTIQLPKSDHEVRYFHDENIIWSGPHEIGDVFTGSFEIMTLASGVHELTLSVKQTGNDFNIKWVLDENGKLLALDNQHIKSNFDILKTYYFDEETLHFKTDVTSKSNPFEYEFTVSPVPKIGEPSTILLRLKANIDYPNGIDYELDIDHIILMSDPEIIDYPVFRNQIIDLKFIIIPEEYNYKHGIRLQLHQDIENVYDYKHRQVIQLNFIFNEDKSLKFVSDQGFLYEYASRYHLNSFESPKNTDRKTVKILKNGNIIKNEHPKKTIRSKKK